MSCDNISALQRILRPAGGFASTHAGMRTVNVVPTATSLSTAHAPAHRAAVSLYEKQTKA